MWQLQFGRGVGGGCSTNSDLILRSIAKRCVSKDGVLMVRDAPLRGAPHHERRFTRLCTFLFLALRPCKRECVKKSGNAHEVDSHCCQGLQSRLRPRVVRRNLNRLSATILDESVTPHGLKRQTAEVAAVAYHSKRVPDAVQRAPNLSCPAKAGHPVNTGIEAIGVCGVLGPRLRGDDVADHILGSCVTATRTLPLASAITRSVVASNSMPVMRSPVTLVSTRTPSPTC